MRTLRPSSLSRTLALLPPAVVLVSQHAAADFKAYIKFDSLVGEGIDKGHEGWTTLPNFSFGFTKPGGGVPIAVEAFTFAKVLDRLSPELFLRCATANPFTTVKIELTDAATSSLFYRLTLNNVSISGLNTSGVTVGSNFPSESVSVRFDNLKIEYFYQGPKGTVAVPPVTWNFLTNSP